MKKLLPLLLFCLFLIPAYAEMTLEKTDSGYDVKIDGKLFAGYKTDFRGVPIIWPIMGPSDQKMTRDYPMIPEGSEGEKLDHPHHRSLWFDHGSVNGADFWSLKDNTIRHEKFDKAECDGKKAVLVTENTWVKGDGTIPCKDVRTIAFWTNGKERFIDFDVVVTAVADELVFGDTKEGSFGLRVPSTLDVVGPRAKTEERGGKITNAQGLTDGKAWAKRSEWVDFSGPINGQPAGIAILNHPDSFRFPTFWHVRTYGLFAANPFGEKDFGVAEPAGELRLPKGESFTLKHRVILHDGDVESIDLNQAFEEYKK
ncbi:MAG: PmoA family protein [Thermoguttaceae bacterium]